MSDKAAACPHCGASAVPAVQTKKCTECGGTLRPEDKVCPTCGCPAEAVQPEQQPAATNPAGYHVSPNNGAAAAAVQKNRKKIIIPIAAGLAVLCAAAMVIILLLNVNRVKDEPFILPYSHTPGTYSGGWKNDMPNGTGTFRYSDTTYEGEWEDGYLKQGKITFYNGSIYEGEFKNFRLNGQGKETSSKGDVLEGEFSNGNIVNGKGRMPFVDVTVTNDTNTFYEGEWHDSKFTGNGRIPISTPNGAEFYEGEFKDGEFNGHGKYTYADGTVQEGQWENGKFLG